MLRAAVSNVVCVLLLVLTAVAGAPREAVPVSGSHTVYVATSASLCTEDSPCFNPCTMGVNGLFPESDPRYYVPGPCTLGSVLPDGARFSLGVTPGDDGRCVSLVSVVAVSGVSLVAVAGAHPCTVPVDVEPLLYLAAHRLGVVPVGLAL